MEKLKEELMSSLESKIAFEIPIFNGVQIPLSVVVTWGIMLFIMIVTIILTWDLKMKPGKRQIIAELIVGFFNKFFGELLGPQGKRYIPFLGTITLYIGLANLVGLFGLAPPTKDLNTTIGLAIMSIILIEYSGIHAKGGKEYLKSFAKPMSIMLPINVLELFIRPLSLSMRLFGNVLGAFIVMELIKIVVPAIVPVPFSFYFDIFDGLIQAYVFVFLTALFMQEKMEIE